MFQKHDLALSRWHVSAAVRTNEHDKFSVVWLPVGPKWRTLRKISAILLLSSQKFDVRRAISHSTEKVSQLMAYVKECCIAGEAIDVGRVAFTTSLNLLSSTFDFASYNSSDSGEFKEIIWRIMEEIEKPAYLVDCYPVLRFLSVFTVIF